jgi:hypothetical protein
MAVKVWVNGYQIDVLTRKDINMESPELKLSIQDVLSQKLFRPQMEVAREFLYFVCPQLSRQELYDMPDEFILELMQKHYNQ